MAPHMARSSAHFFRLGVERNVGDEDKRKNSKNRYTSGKHMIDARGAKNQVGYSTRGIEGRVYVQESPNHCFGRGLGVSLTEVHVLTFCQVRRLLYCMWGLDHVQSRFHVVLSPKPVGSSSHCSHLRRQPTGIGDMVRARFGSAMTSPLMMRPQAQGCTRQCGGYMLKIKPTKKRLEANVMASGHA